jgi:hypothetical protein
VEGKDGEGGEGGWGRGGEEDSRGGVRGRNRGHGDVRGVTGGIGTDVDMFLFPFYIYMHTYIFTY